MFLPGCGAVLKASLLVVAGVFCFITSILWAWPIHWGLGLTMAVMAGICFGNAYATIQND